MNKTSLSREEQSVFETLKNADLLFLAVRGLDGSPSAWPLRPPAESGGTIWFAAAKNTRLYAELSLHPECTLGCFDASGCLFRLSGKAFFQEDGEAGSPFPGEDPVLRAISETDPRLLLPFCLTGRTAEFYGPEGALLRKISLPDPGGLLTGPKIRKKTELRDRMSRILEEREAEGSPAPKNEEEANLRRLRDGALLIFAEECKKLWPRMDIRPIERAAVFETYDEREEWCLRAKKLLGAVTISFPEDLTNWLSPDRLAELAKSGKE